jgi:phosphoribosylaminoimidazolecarboxamide formyltransferase/IMP cyclohydrolase
MASGIHLEEGKTMRSPPIKRALISVSEKLGLAGFARGLAAAGVEIFSTGGTRNHLESEGIAVRDVSEYTGFPEMMDGRLKTLHPKVFGGILCRHDNPNDMTALDEHDIVSFELVVVNLYPFEATIARAGVTVTEAIEKIDIGGPSLVRAAAKNHAFTTVATSAEQYAAILEEVQAHGATSPELRQRLAAEAFAHTAKYDQAIAGYFADQTAEGPFPGTLNPSFRRKAVLRYGENPHQRAALYVEADPSGANLVSARQLHGKDLSYNNLLDLDSALEIARSFAGPAVSVIKHNNPCGAAEADTLAEALRKGMAGDPTSAFGSVLGMNRAVDAATAEALSEPGLFIEAIVAPDFDPGALEILTTKPKWKANVRLMKVGHLEQQQESWEHRHIDGGLLMQDGDAQRDPEADWKAVTDGAPTDEQMADLRFAWTVVRFVKSNAIVLCKDRMLVGAGAGQMSRVDSVEISIRKAGDRVTGSVLASDAFFPFPDSIERAAAAGVAAVIQPGGSRNDDEVIAACNGHKLPMIFTARRHFRH